MLYHYLHLCVPSCVSLGEGGGVKERNHPGLDENILKCLPSKRYTPAA